MAGEAGAWHSKTSRNTAWNTTDTAVRADTRSAACVCGPTACSHLQHDDERLAGRRHSTEPVHVVRYVLRAAVDADVPRSEPNVLVLRVCLRRQSVRVKDGADTD